MILVQVCIIIYFGATKTISIDMRVKENQPIQHAFL